jgi:endonuclease/exonuclease/phosphatase family metal-dependent hydrolase
MRKVHWPLAAGLWLIAGFALFGLPGCGGDDAVDYTPAVPTALPTRTPPSTQPTGDAVPEPTEIKVAFVNIMSPLSLDSTNTQASDTYDARLDLLIQQLKELKPDIIGLSEVTDTTAHGSAKDRLAKELKMEAYYVWANPWIPGQTREQNDRLAEQIGFREGELLLSRFPILESKQTWLNPRTSELEGRAGLWVRLRGPTSVGDIDVYLTHLTGGGEKVRTSQSASLLSFVTATRGKGPALIMGDLSDDPATTTYKEFADAGFKDIASGSTGFTCCRDAVVGYQPPATVRTDHVFVAGWPQATLTVWGDKPKKQKDGTLLYSSDHNGLFALFPLVNASP